MLAINFSIQLNSINNLESIKNNRADYYNFYFKNINHKNYNSISEILKKIDRTTEGHKIIFDSNLSEDIYYVYSKNKLRKIKFDKLRPIKNLIYYQKNNELEDFLKKTNFKKIKPNEVFLISVDYSNSNVIDNFTILEKSKIFENQCKLIYKPIFSENVFISGEKKIFLHKVSCSLI